MAEEPETQTPDPGSATTPPSERERKYIVFEEVQSAAGPVLELRAVVDADKRRDAVERAVEQDPYDAKLKKRIEKETVKLAVVPASAIVAVELGTETKYEQVYRERSDSSGWKPVDR